MREKYAENTLFVGLNVLLELMLKSLSGKFFGINFSSIFNSAIIYLKREIGSVKCYSSISGNISVHPSLD